MGKIVKYCSECEESFAEKFTFCPNCSKEMSAFEMNPLSEDVRKMGTVGKHSTPITAAKDFDDEILNKNHFEEETSSDDLLEIFPAEDESSVEIFADSDETNFSANTAASNFDTKTVEDVKIEEEKEEEIEAAKEEEIRAETVPLTVSAAAGSFANGNGNKSFADTNGNTAHSSKTLRGAFEPTVLKEKNVKMRNGLLLGSMFLMLSVALGSFVYSLFNYNVLVGAIDGDSALLASLIDEVPVQIEEEKPAKPSKDDGGGGGGGGKNETKPASKGQLPTQTEKPTFPPSVTIPKISNPTLPVEVSTQGKIKRKTTNERYGLPDSLSDDLSNGPGSGGGIGRGRGTGVGGGLGTGEGNGKGSGSGNGDGNGNGNGKGDGDNARARTVETKPEPAGPSQKYRITSKPRADYTNEARENQVTGIVSLRVTLNANGSVGSISPINRLPYGLTEKAIAAAKQIRFEPQLKNGVAQTVRVQIQYNFTIY